MLKPQSPWLDFHDVLEHAPVRPIHSRSILKNELVLEIDSENWQEVRDGTRRILAVLDSWGAEGSYYLSYSGNRSIHVHVFMETSSMPVHEDVVPLLQGHDDVISQFKSYMTLQISRASNTVVDMQLTGTHLIRMEGGFNEKSRKYCTQISEIPEERPQYYDVIVPSKLPPKFWDLSRFENEVNAFLKVHYSRISRVEYHPSGRPIDPEPLKEILKPVFIPGYRHFMVMALAGWLKRHAVEEDKALEIVRALNPHDMTPFKTAATIREAYRAPETDRVPGLPKLLEIIGQIGAEGKIKEDIAAETIQALEALNRGMKEVPA